MFTIINNNSEWSIKILRHRVREQSIQNTCLSHRNFLISELWVFSHLDIYVNELSQQLYIFSIRKFVYYELFYVLFGLHICARSPTVFQGFSPIQKKFLRWSVMTDLIFLRSILLSDSRAAVITETKFRYKWSGKEFPLWVCLIFHFVKKIYSLISKYYLNSKCGKYNQISNPNLYFPYRTY